MGTFRSLDEVTLETLQAEIVEIKAMVTTLHTFILQLEQAVKSHPLASRMMGL